MSNHNPVEWTGNIQVFHPVKAEPVAVYADWFNKDFEEAAQRFARRGGAITFYREVEERRAAA